MSIEVWPFLVSRNPIIDYRTVVAPDFICKAGIAKLLARVAEGDLTQPGFAIRREILGSKEGNFTVVFRVIYARAKHLNPLGGKEVLKDSFGREIDLVEGIVFRGVDEIQVKEQDLKKAHELLMEPYKKFWDLQEPASVIPSNAFHLDLNTPNRPLEIQELPPFQIHSKIVKSEPLLPPKKPKSSLTVLVVSTLALMILGMLLSPFFRGNSIGQNTKPSIGNVITYTTQEETIEFKNQNAYVSLKDLSKKFPNSAIFLRGKLALKSSEKIIAPSRSDSPKQTISLSRNNKLEMNNHPYSEMIVHLLNDNVLNGTITATIIQPSSDQISPRLCFQVS